MSGGDVVVVGGGLVGLAVALALADRDAEVVLVDEPRLGAASPAAAGLLAPSLGDASAAVRHFGTVARDRYPGYVDMLRERSGIVVPLDREGILDVAMDEEHAERLRAELGAAAEWLPPAALARTEPALGHAAGAVLHAADGAVDNVVLLEALARVVGATGRVRRVGAAAISLDLGAAPATVRTADGRALEAGTVVLAGGAWSGRLGGLPRPLPVEPVRGQILVLEGAPVRHVVHGPEGYLVPRGGIRTLVGSTSEPVGFDPSTTAVGLAALAQAATRLCPALVGAPPVEEWAGLRPMTPDLLPIIGAEPEAPALIYACGHSRNGILTGPLTGECVAALVRGDPLPVDLAPFAADRFSSRAAGQR